MKNTFSSFANMLAVAACALALGSCSRAEYAMLPKGSSYHGVARVATPVPPVAAPAAAAPVAEAPAPAVAPKAAQPAVAATKAPAAPAESKAVSATEAASGPAAVAANPVQKLNAFQRLALNKVTRKVDKLLQKSATARQHDNTASTTRGGGISGNLRIGLILLLIGLLLGLISPLVGTIVAIIGLVFIVLWLLDQA